MSIEVLEFLYFGCMYGLANHIDINDWLLGIFYFLIILSVAWIYKIKKAKHDPIYKWFLPGLLVKIFSGIAFVLLYAYYYQGGDTYSYYLGTKALANLTFENFNATLKMLAGGNSPELRSAFTYNTGMPWSYIYSNPNTWAVCRYSYPYMLLSFNRIIPTIILLNTFAFIGPWQFFKVLAVKFPERAKHMAFAALFIPSCLFWGSGLIKDTFTFSATLWLLALFFRLLQNRKLFFLYLFLIVINSYIIISTKAYVFVALLPTVALWMAFDNLRKIKNKLIRYTIAPLLIIGVMMGGMAVFRSLQSDLGQYGDFDAAMKKAETTKNDLIQAQYYSENYYDVGDFDASFIGLIRKFPLSFTYGAFGPFLWEASSLLIFLSAFESAILLLLTIWVILRSQRNKVWSKIKNDSFIAGALVFIIIFLFFVGLSTGNYGALVRYRIPALPLYWVLIFVFLRKRTLTK